MINQFVKYVLYLAVITTTFLAKADSYVDFFRAVNVDNAGKVSELLDKGFDPNTKSENGQTGLYLAMQEDSPKVAAVLLAA